MIRRKRTLLVGLAMMLALPCLETSAKSAYAAPPVADGCVSGARSDFNDDGWTDTVIADPTATVGGQADAGRVIVLYGDADGLVGEGARDALWQGEESVGGVAESGDRFGASLAAADLDCDGYTDLVVGTPNEDINGQSDSGYVQVIWGASTGLGTGKASDQYSQSSFGEPIRAGDQFGFSVDAVEDLGQGGTPDPDAYALAIGVPGADVGGDNNAGALAVESALDGGTGRNWITQDTAGVEGAAEAGDRFGAAVTCSYLLGNDDFIDCAVGVPNEDVGSAKDAGSVTVLRDIYGDELDGGIGLDQNSVDVPGTAEAGDLYGRDLDSVVVGGNARLAVGAPGEDVGKVKNAGLVQLFSSNFIEISAGTALTQDTPGVADSAQSGDIFGDRVAWAAPGPGDPLTRLAVSATKEDVGSGSEAGMVQVFTIGDLDAEQTFTQSTTGVAGSPGDGDHFGGGLAVVGGPNEKAMLVGVPDDSSNTAGMVNVIPLTPGAPRFWKPGTSGIVSAGADRFGAGLASVTG